MFSNNSFFKVPSVIVTQNEQKNDEINNPGAKKAFRRLHWKEGDTSRCQQKLVHRHMQAHTHTHTYASI